jgi:hypothetical protein
MLLAKAIAPLYVLYSSEAKKFKFVTIDPLIVKLLTISVFSLFGCGDVLELRLVLALFQGILRLIA